MIITEMGEELIVPTYLLRINVLKLLKLYFLLFRVFEKYILLNSNSNFYSQQWICIKYVSIYASFKHMIIFGKGYSLGPIITGTGSYLDLTYPNKANLVQDVGNFLPCHDFFLDLRIFFTLRVKTLLHEK